MEYNKDYQKFLNKTSADYVQEGFDFQFFTFFYLLLNMEKDSTIEYETDDDVLYIRSDGTRELIQAKNAIEGPNGNVPNLTINDIAVWHTIDNWITQFELSKESNFFVDRKFKIWTNRNFENNTFYTNIQKFQQYDTEIETLHLELDSLIEDSQSDEIKAIMKKLKSLNLVHRKQFYQRFSIEQFEGTSIIEKIKSTLYITKSIQENKIDKVYSSLFTELKDNKFIKVFKREKTKLTAEQVHKICKRSFNRAFDRTLSIDRSFENKIPSDINDHTFIKQLIDIEYLFEDDIDKIREMHIKRLGATNSLWSARNIEGDIDKTDLINIEKNCFDKWKLEFDLSGIDIRRKLFKNKAIISEEESISAGLLCFINISRFELKYDSIQFDQEMTLGYFYDMSDEPRIGWRHDWNEKYKLK